MDSSNLPEIIITHYAKKEVMHCLCKKLCKVYAFSGLDPTFSGLDPILWVLVAMDANNRNNTLAYESFPFSCIVPQGKEVL